MEESRQASANATQQQQPPIAVFVRDGKNYVKLVHTAPGKACSGTAPIRYVTTSTARVVKQATVGVNANKSAQPTQGAPTRAIGNASNNSKMSPWKAEPAILPKPVHVTTAPMILAAPPRLIGIPASPRTRPASGTSCGDQIGWSGKGNLDYSESDFSDGGKRIKKGEKGGKGLRHFSMKVCEKVQKKGVTSYNEVADELVAEFSDPGRSASPTDQAYDQKNIRRRVYDALNVLMAMNIISKEKKEIRWLGLPTNSAQECQNLEVEKFKRLERIKIKRQQLNELILQQIAFKSLVERNKQVERSYGVPNPNSAIQLPFIIVNTSKKTIIDCSISNDKMEYLFNFDNTFEIHDDIEILKRMGMTCGLEKGECSVDDLEKVKQMVPRALTCYVTQMAQENAMLAVQDQDSRPETVSSSLSADYHETSGITNKRGISDRDVTAEGIGFQNDDLVEVGTWGSDMADVAGAKGVSRQSSVASEKSASLGGDDDDEMDDDDEEEDEDLFGASGGDTDDDDMDQH